MSWEALDDFTWKQIFALAIGNNIRRSRTYIPRTYDPLTWRSIRMCCARWRNIVDPCPSIGIMWALLRTIRDNNPVAFETYLREIYEAPMIGGSYSIGNIRAKEDMRRNMLPIMTAIFAAPTSRYFRAFIEIYGAEIGCEEDRDTYFDDQIRTYIARIGWSDTSIREFIDYYSDCAIDWSFIEPLRRRYLHDALTSDLIWRAMYGHRTYAEVNLTSRSRAINYLIVLLVSRADGQICADVHEIMRAQYSDDKREHLRVLESLDTWAPSQGNIYMPMDEIQRYESTIIDSVTTLSHAAQSNRTERMFSEYYRDIIDNMETNTDLAKAARQFAIWTTSHISRESIAERSLYALDKIMTFVTDRDNGRQSDIEVSYYRITLANWLIDDILKFRAIKRPRSSMIGDAIASAICGGVPVREFEIGFAKIMHQLSARERIVERVILWFIDLWEHIAHPYVILRILLEVTNPYKLRDNFFTRAGCESIRAMIDSHVAAK